MSVAGMPTNVNSGEAKHKEVKQHSAKTSGRDVLIDLWKTNNNNLAIKSVADGVVWRARGYVEGRWEWKTVSAGPVCREVLQSVFTILPLAPASTGDHRGSADAVGGRPHGYVQWDVALKGEAAPSDGTLEPWQAQVALTILGVRALEERYDETLGCGRTEEETPCGSPSCSYCWRNRSGPGLTHRVVSIFNHWGGAHPEASGGSGTL